MITEKIIKHYKWVIVRDDIIYQYKDHLISGVDIRYKQNRVNRKLLDLNININGNEFVTFDGDTILSKNKNKNNKELVRVIYNYYKRGEDIHKFISDLREIKINNILNN